MCARAGFGLESSPEHRPSLPAQVDLTYRLGRHLRERPAFDRPYRRFSVRLYEHTGAVILWHQRTFTCTGTLAQCEKAYRDAQTHNLLAGW